ncbi:hypothetical protein ACNOYE_34970 [Nannocystaceae bacterium ST9]
MRPRLGLLGLGLLAACRASEPAIAEPSPEPAPIVVESEPAPNPAPDLAGERSSDGHCEPTPREGDPCDAARDSWCVLDWGEPGGHSSALWCRSGRWELEQEVNLD